MVIRSRRAQRSRCRLLVEWLEDRRVLSHVFPPPIDPEPIAQPMPEETHVLVVAAGQDNDAAATQITSLANSAIVAAAVSRWQAAGVSSFALSILKSASVDVMNLPGGVLGAVVNGSIIIDNDGAGTGWFIDPTPSDDAEFLAGHGTGAAQSSDLLSVLVHEMGHLMGLGHSETGFMSATLAQGIRLVPLPGSFGAPANESSAEGESPLPVASSSSSPGVIAVLPTSTTSSGNIVSSSAISGDTPDSSSGELDVPRPLPPRDSVVPQPISAPSTAAVDDYLAHESISVGNILSVNGPERTRSVDEIEPAKDSVVRTGQLNIHQASTHGWPFQFDDRMSRRLVMPDDARRHDAALMALLPELEELPPQAILAVGILLSSLGWSDSAGVGSNEPRTVAQIRRKRKNKYRICNYFAD